MGDEMNESNGDAGDGGIGRLVAEFEACAVTKFGHAEHLTVALWYLSRLPEAEARERVCAGLRKLSALDNDGRYNETMTLFWLRAVAAFLRESDPALPLPALRERLVARFPSSRVILDYYSPELLHSHEAKTSRVEPDLKRFDF